MSSQVDLAYNKSFQLLKDNSVGVGFIASTPTEESTSKDYSTIFGRDASICALGAYFSGEEVLQKTSIDSLKTLFDSMSYFGQIPFYFDPAKKRSSFYFPNSIDGTPWWVIASLSIASKLPELLELPDYQEGLTAAISWLAHLAHPHSGLIAQDECCDWADAMPRHGYVLYTNVLWFKALGMYLHHVGGDQILNDYYLKLEASLNNLFWTNKKSTGNRDYFPKGKILENARLVDELEYINSHASHFPYYLTSVSKFQFDWRCDVYGNILAVLFGVADEEKTATIIDWLWRSSANNPYPVRAYYPPIYPGSPDWRDYMYRRRQNFPWQYHNGGIWPYIGGFWVYLLAKLKDNRAESELKRLAEANALNDWEFNEYLHGETGSPMGMIGQSWNGATYLLAYNALKHGQFPL